jgi:hypothetical protein
VSKSAWFHLVSTFAWLPATALIIVLNLQNSVFLVLLLSIYANVKTDWGDYHAARAEETDANN